MWCFCFSTMQNPGLKSSLDAGRVSAGLEAKKIFSGGFLAVKAGRGKGRFEAERHLFSHKRCTAAAGITAATAKKSPRAAGREQDSRKD